MTESTLPRRLPSSCAPVNMRSYSIVLAVLLLFSIYRFGAVFHSLPTAPMTNAAWLLDPSAHREDTIPDAPCPQYHDLLQINENSSLADDIINITHIQSESKIIVHLKKNETRLCKQPQLIGRLSGPALLTVSWEQHMHSLENITLYDMVVGTYHAPVSGAYFLEIIATLCVELEHETDVRPLCVVDPQHHRLTKDDTSINATTSISNSSSAVGYWYNNQNATLVSKYDPLYTRYQPQDCPKSTNLNSFAHCIEAMDLSRFEPYEFRFSTPEMSLKDVVKANEGNICFAGSSHSRVLTDLLYSTVKSLGHTTNLTVTYEGYANFLKYVRSYFTMDYIQIFIDSNCTKVVLGTGQWDASWKQRHPTSFNDYEKYLGEGLERMDKILRQANIDLYVRETQ